MEERRVVITGMGVISPVGLDVPTMWENLAAGRSGIGAITLFDASNFLRFVQTDNPDILQESFF